MHIDVKIVVAGLAVLLVAAVGLGAHDAAADTISAPITVGNSPRVVAVAPTVGKVYVANRLANTLSVISTSSDSVVKTIGATHPGALHVGNTGSRIFVPDHDITGGTLTVIDTTTDAPIAGSPASTGGLFPSAIDTTPDDSRIVVTNELSNSVMVLDGNLAPLKYLDNVGIKPHAVVINPAGTKAYVANKGSNDVTVIDISASPPAIVKHISVGAEPDSMRFVGNGNILWVANFLSNTITRIDTTSDTTIGSPIPVGNSPHGLVDNASGSIVLVANQSSSTVTALDGGTGAVLATMPVGTTAGASPQRIHMTADGKRAYVPNEGEDTVSVIDVQALKVIANLTVGGAPASLEVLGSGKVYVADKADNTVSVITVQEQAAPPPPAPTNTPAPTDTPRPGDTSTPVPAASSTPRPGDTPAPTTTPDPGAPVDPGTPTDPAAPTPGGGVAGIAATPSGGTPASGTPAATAAASGTAKAGTPSVVPSRTAKATAPAGSIANDAGAAAAGDSQGLTDASAGGGGAPSWIWLAAGLGSVAVAGGGGYAGRNRIAALLSRFKR